MNRTYSFLQGLSQNYLRQAWLKLRSLFLRLSRDKCGSERAGDLYATKTRLMEPSLSPERAMPWPQLSQGLDLLTQPITT